MANLRTCCICHKEYKYCPKCGDDKTEIWKNTFCSENCRSIYNLCRKFAEKTINGLAAKKMLKNLDISRIEYFPNGIKGNIENILSFKDETKSTKKKTKEIVND